MLSPELELPDSEQIPSSSKHGPSSSVHGQRTSELELSSLAEEHAFGSSSSQSPSLLDEKSTSSEELLCYSEDVDSITSEELDTEQLGRGEPHAPRLEDIFFISPPHNSAKSAGTQ